MAYSMCLRGNPISIICETTGGGGSVDFGGLGCGGLGCGGVVFLEEEVGVVGEVPPDGWWGFFLGSLGCGCSVLGGLCTSEARNWHTETAAV